MLETLLEQPFSLKRHHDAPLLAERQAFLHHLQQQGTSRAALRNMSGELIHVVRLLRLYKLRDVGQEEIQRAAQRWAREQRSNPKAHSYGNTASFFIYAAKISLGLQTLKESDQYWFNTPIHIAEDYARLGEKDKAFEWLEKAYQERDGIRLGFVNSNDGFNKLHGDPRYSDLLRRVGLPE